MNGSDKLVGANQMVQRVKSKTVTKSEMSGLIQISSTNKKTLSLELGNS